MSRDENWLKAFKDARDTLDAKPIPLEGRMVKFTSEESRQRFDEECMAAIRKEI